MLDTVIRGADVVDGTGAPRRRADVGMKAGRVVTVGTVDDSATRTIDGAGLVLAPGFIDVHTHFDAQVFWDPALTPSPLHGVTSIVAGNCGFSIAPLSDDAGDYLVRMLSRVEGMPLAALRQGVPWNWSTTAEYFSRVEGTLAMNAGFMVGHSAMRRVVMGEEATSRQCTEAELESMKSLLRDGLAAGGMGFSTSRGSSHQDWDGNPVPSRHASADEIVALAAVCKEFPGTSLEMVPTGWLFDDFEKDLMPRMTVEAQRPLNWNLVLANADSLPRHLTNLELGTEAHRRGGRIVALAMPIDFPARFCFLTPFVLDGLPGWGHPMALPVADRLQLLRDPVERKRLEELAAATKTHVHVVDWGNKLIAETFMTENKRYEGRRVADIAAEEGKSPFDALVDIVCVDELRTGFTRIPPESTPADWEARARIWRDERTLIGGSDAGAHLDFLATFNYTTHLLQHAVRDAQALSLEECVRMLTHDPARLYGLRDRGVVREGAVADLVLLDPDTVGTEDVRTRCDLPGGAGRLYAGAIGIDRVFVAGTEIVEAGAMTGARPGQLLKSGRDTETPALV
jgi:N-acyl-D-aspartate/D-glutamate deacylase